MYEYPVAVISDVHGNRWALEAVLEDMERRGVCDIVNLGDCVYGPLDPAGTADILIQLDIPTVRGNEDRIIVEPERNGDSPTLRMVKECLHANHKQWLASLPLTAVAYDDFFLCHGIPQRDDVYLLWEVTASGAHRKTADEVLTALPASGPPVLLCGHDHVPSEMCFPNGRLVVNPGSVGLAAYTDDTPFPHIMEAGTPHARYCIISPGAAERQVQCVAVAYDWQSAAGTARINGRADWARWLTTGRANG